MIGFAAARQANAPTQSPPFFTQCGQLIHGGDDVRMLGT
jgi:hypothetical protein